ncbi:MAG: hypothetical protein KDA33_15935, partial [Phycisphaerales bacterium]|nr:hypothetical protein [Phycisphaerales bacterium]
MQLAYRSRACARRRLLMAGVLLFIMSGPRLRVAPAADRAFSIITELDGRFSASDRLMAESDA